MALDASGRKVLVLKFVEGDNLRDGFSVSKLENVQLVLVIETIYDEVAAT